ncbi:MAG: acylphosphatase [Nitrososphaerota archaeon]|nr:acylphosphatase [Nitrososphaerota archaeon]
MNVAVRVRVRGMVHGVAFRATMAEVAKDEGVAGWVRNLSDGSVEAFLEGNEGPVASVVEWARTGPSRARVDSVEVRSAEPRDLKGFRIAG